MSLDVPTGASRAPTRYQRSGTPGDPCRRTLPLARCDARLATLTFDQEGQFFSHVGRVKPLRAGPPGSVLTPVYPERPRLQLGCLCPARSWSLGWIVLQLPLPLFSRPLCQR